MFNRVFTEFRSDSGENTEWRMLGKESVGESQIASGGRMGCNGRHCHETFRQYPGLTPIKYLWKLWSNIRYSFRTFVEDPSLTTLKVSGRHKL